MILRNVKVMINITGKKRLLFISPQRVPTTLSLGRRACKQQKTGMKTS